MLATTTATTIAFFSLAKGVITPFNFYARSLNECMRYFFSRTQVNLLCCGTRNFHVSTALLLRKAFMIYETNSFVFFHTYKNRFFAFITSRNKKVIHGKPTYFSTFFWTGHKTSKLLRVVCMLFMAYAINIQINLFWHMSRIILICFSVITQGIK